jgi:hypothetical protein
MPKHAQVSQEYFFLFVFIIFLVIGSIIFLQRYLDDYSQEFVESRTRNILEKITENADKISAFGAGTNLAVDINMPEGITNFTIFHNIEGNCDICTEMIVENAFGTVVVMPSKTWLNSSNFTSYECDTFAIPSYCVGSFPTDYIAEGKKEFLLKSFGNHVDISLK